jgi:hypothetical protein
MGRYELTLTMPRSKANPLRVEINGASWSKPVSDVGTFNAEVPTRHLKDAGLLPDPRGRWVAWAHGALVWAGVVTAVRDDAGSGTTELVARTWEWLLQGRRAPRFGQTNAANPGDLLRRAIADRSRGSDPIGLEVLADRTGAAIPLVARGSDLLDLLRDVVRRGGGDYTVDHATRTLVYRNRIGVDRSGTVVLSEGRHVVGYRRDLDLEALYNEVLVTPADEPYGRTRSVEARDDASIRRHGLRQTSIVVEGLVTRAALRPAAEAELARLVGLGQTLSLEVANVDRCWESFAEGDAITAVLPGVNARYRLATRIINYDTDTDLLGVTGSVEEVDA